MQHQAALCRSCGMNCTQAEAALVRCRMGSVCSHAGAYAAQCSWTPPPGAATHHHCEPHPKSWVACPHSCQSLGLQTFVFCQHMIVQQCLCCMRLSSEEALQLSLPPKPECMHKPCADNHCNVRCHRGCVACRMTHWQRQQTCRQARLAMHGASSWAAASSQQTSVRR